MQNNEVKKVKIDFYDGINTICPFVCPTCGKPTLMTKCPNCGQLLKFPKMDAGRYTTSTNNLKGKTLNER